MSKEVIIYKSTDGFPDLTVHLENEDVWLNQKQLAELYQTAKSTVSEHIKNIYTDEELTLEATVRKIRTVQTEGKELAHTKAKEKAIGEYKKYKDKTLSSVETAYLKTLSNLEKKAKKGGKA